MVSVTPLRPSRLMLLWLASPEWWQAKVYPAVGLARCQSSSKVEQIGIRASRNSELIRRSARSKIRWRALGRVWPRLISHIRFELFEEPSIRGVQMPTGIRPRVNEAREFLEIAKDFKDPKEIIREALSNSWDAGATRVALHFDLVAIPDSRKKKIRVTIEDNGEGMSSAQRESVGSSEIEGFFNLGDSAKGEQSIGSKGHGTKIYYRSHGISLVTWKGGQSIRARMESDPWDSLKRGIVPTFAYDEVSDPSGRGTRIVVDGFEAKQSEFSSLDELTKYIRWYTVAGSFGHFFGEVRTMEVGLHPIGGTDINVPFGFRFPDENTDLSQSTEEVCKVFPATTLEAGTTSEGQVVKVQVVGALLGEAHRSIVPSTYEHMGLWLAKDYIRIERSNSVLEDAFKGQYFYRNFLIFANCQMFDLTANRNNIRTSQEAYDMAKEAIREWCEALRDSEFVVSYFARKREEDDQRKQAEAANSQKEKEQRALGLREARINSYKGRADLIAPTVRGAPRKEPRSEAETALLLQAMISSGHPGVDFVIGDYNTARGVDLLVERTNKGISGYWWVELVSTLEKLAQWSHHPEGYHAVVCYELGNTPEVQTLSDGSVARLVKKAQGRYTLLVGAETLEVYVLRELLASAAQTKS